MSLDRRLRSACCGLRNRLVSLRGYRIVIGLCGIAVLPDAADRACPCSGAANPVSGLCPITHPVTAWAVGYMVVRLRRFETARTLGVRPVLDNGVCAVDASDRPGPASVVPSLCLCHRSSDLSTSTPRHRPMSCSGSPCGSGCRCYGSRSEPGLADSSCPMGPCASGVMHGAGFGTGEKLTDCRAHSDCSVCSWSNSDRLDQGARTGSDRNLGRSCKPRHNPSRNQVVRTGIKNGSGSLSVSSTGDVGSATSHRSSARQRRFWFPQSGWRVCTYNDTLRFRYFPGIEQTEKKDGSRLEHADMPCSREGQIFLFQRPEVVRD
jgi:hypothetical protein